jgi:hypothetical protein
MQVIMGDTLNLIGQINPDYAHEIFVNAEKSGTINAILGKDGKEPKYFYIQIEDLDMTKLEKTNVEKNNLKKSKKQ